MRPPGSAEQLEARRLLAMRLLDEGRTNIEVAYMVGASVSSIRRWKAAARVRGMEALRAKPHPGASRRLTSQEEEELTRVLLSGEFVGGAKPGQWNCSQVATLIESRFGVVYHVDHVWRVLRRLGWNYLEANGWVHCLSQPGAASSWKSALASPDYS